MSTRALLRERLQRLLDRLDDDDREALTIVGGTAPALYELPEIVTVRPTKDIDVVIEAVTYVEWQRFVRRLEALGFRHRADDDEPMCRYADGDLVLDVMPTEPSALGFGSRWYPEAVEQRVRALDLDVHVISPVYFLATKLEAWPSEERSGGDPMVSHDVEDIISVIRGLPELLDELRDGTAPVQREVRAGLDKLFDEDTGLELIAAHLEGDAATQALAVALLERIRGAVSAG